MQKNRGFLLHLKAKFKCSTFKTVPSPSLDGQIRLQANEHILIFLVKRCLSSHPLADLCLPDDSLPEFQCNVDVDVM